MSYKKQNFLDGQTLTAEHLNNMESGIVANETAIETLSKKLDEQPINDSVTSEDIKTALGYIPANKETTDLSVLFTQQELTEEQKAQARANIGIVLEEDDEDVTTNGYEYTYDGNIDSDEYIWVCEPSGVKSFVKVAEVPNDDLDLVGAEVSVLVPEWPRNNYTFTITNEMLEKASGLTQVLYQNANTNDQTPQAMVVICTKTGVYDINLNGWVANLNFAQTGIYLMDSREAWGGKYVESLRRGGVIEPEENEENPVEYNGNEIQVFARGLCIGDSITEGVFNYSGGQTVIKKYSYPSVLKRITGIDVVNAGVGGLTSKTWYDASINSDTQYGTWVNGEWVWHVSPDAVEGDVVSKSLDYSGFDFSVIHLGINDVLSISESITLETALSTFETNINNIITKLKDSNTGIKIFLATIIPCYAYDGSVEYATFNEKIREITNSTDNVYLIDLNEYSALVHGSPYVNKHLTAIGYHKMASEISAYISYIIHENLEDFKWVQFIGTDYTA